MTWRMGRKMEAQKLSDNKKRGRLCERYSTDRFIGIRRHRTDICSIHHFERKADERYQKRKDILFQDLKEEQKEKYKSSLRKILRIPEPFESILKITYGQPFFEESEKHWPVRPRKHPCLSVPELVLDMPQFSADMSINTVDWGKSGLASSLHDAIFIWNGSREVRRITSIDMQSNTESIATALKWDNTGRLLAVGMQDSCIQIWNAETMKKISESWCHCRASTDICVITAFAWHPVYNIVMSGCSRGHLEIYSKSESLIKKSSSLQVMESINSVTFSADGNMIAISSFSGKLRIMTWSLLTPCLEFPISTCRAYAWHPWDSSLIVIGGVTYGGDMHVWNIKKGKIVASYFTNSDSKIIALTWSPITAELVVSMQVAQASQGLDAAWKTEILVLASLNKTVDRLDMEGTHCHSPYILWSPDGCDIATASSDETLRIWNFLGVHKRCNPFATYKKKPKYSKRHKTNSLLSFNNLCYVLR